MFLKVQIVQVAFQEKSFFNPITEGLPVTRPKSGCQSAF